MISIDSSLNCNFYLNLSASLRPDWLWLIPGLVSWFSVWCSSQREGSPDVQSVPLGFLVFIVDFTFVLLLITVVRSGGHRCWGGGGHRVGPRVAEALRLWRGQIITIIIIIIIMHGLKQCNNYTLWSALSWNKPKNKWSTIDFTCCRRPSGLCET